MNSSLNKFKTLGYNEEYKYLGIYETNKSTIKHSTKTNIINKITSRIDSLCKTNLNAKNLFKAINEYAISTINYYIGLIEFEPEEFAEIDKMIRQILIKNNAHYKPANKERLYMNRNKLGRGLSLLEHRSESMLFKFNKNIKHRSRDCIRAFCILSM